MSEENACPYGSSISGVQAQNMQGSCACHPRHCLGVLRIFLTASPLPPALSHHDGQGAQGLHSGKLATSSDKSLTTRRARFYQAYLPETAPPQQTAYHSIVPPYVCTDTRLPRSHLGTMPRLGSPPAQDLITPILSPLRALISLALRPLGRASQQICCAGQHQWRLG